MIEDEIAERLSDAMGTITDRVDQLRDAITNVVGLHHPSQQAVLVTNASGQVEEAVMCAECGQSRAGERLCNTLRALAVPLGVL